MRKDSKRFALALCLAAMLALWACEGDAANDDGGDGDTPPLVATSDESPSDEPCGASDEEEMISSDETEAHNRFWMDQFDSFKETYVGGTRGGSIGYLGSPAILSYEISDPSVISFAFAETYVYAEVGLESYVSQNFEITGLKPGRAAVEITFADENGDPRIFETIEVVVYDEIWPGYPYHH